MFKKLVSFLCHRTPKKNYSFNNISSILISPYVNLGDAVVVTATFARIKDAYPNVRLGVVVSKYNKAIFQKCPLIDVFVDYGFASALVQRGKWEVYYDYPDFSTKGIIFQEIIDADFVVCMNKGAIKRFNLNNMFNYDEYCPITKGSHLRDSVCFTAPMADKNCDLNNSRYVLSAPNTSENPYKHIRKEKPIVLLCVEGSARAIPISVLVDAMKEFSSLPLTWVLLNTTKASEYYDNLKNIVGLDISLAPKTDFNGFYSHVFFADAVFTIDTSTVHIACGFKKPLIALYANDQNAIRHMGPLNYEGVALIHPKESSELNDFSYFTSELIIKQAMPLLREISSGKKGNFLL